MEDVTDGAPRRRLLPLIPPALLYVAITVQSAFVIPLRPFAFRFGDKVLHAAAYGLLALLFARALTEGLRWAPARAVLVIAVAAGAAALGAVDELHQAFVPGRHADVLDGVADTVGAVVGASAWVLWQGRGRS